MLVPLLDTVADLEPRPAGFGACGRCPWRRPGSAPVCHRCAAGELPDRPGPRCAVCDQPLPAGGSCRNGWCHRLDRAFSAVWAVGRHTDRLRWALHDYKVEGNRAWAPVFGRLLVGFLDDHLPWFEEYDLIVAAPTYLGPGARRRWDHVAAILDAAAHEDGGFWPWEPQAEPVLARTGECGRMSALGAAQRRSHAETRLRPTISVARPDRIRGRRVLVFDDVFTEGSTLRELARALRQAGAVEVAGLVLARQPWLGGTVDRSEECP